MPGRFSLDRSARPAETRRAASGLAGQSQNVRPRHALCWMTASERLAELVARSPQDARAFTPIRANKPAGWGLHLSQLVRWEGYVAEPSSSQVYVQVVELDPGREIGWGSSVAQQLQDRAADIERGITAASETIAASLGSLAAVEGWELEEVSASFGVTLTAEAGVIVSKASAGATFDVSFGFKRVPPRAAEPTSA